MSQQDAFAALIRRVRAGDADAAAQLVRTYEPEVRRAVRTWLTDPRLRRIFDSLDICQSVLASFFVRAAAGQLDLERPEQLLNLLVTMAHNKVRDVARRQHAARRDVRRQGGEEVLEAVADSRDSPSQVVADRELLQEVWRRLSAEERSLAEQRAQGRGWAEIASERNDSADRLRMCLSRAIDRVARELHLDEVDDV